MSILEVIHMDMIGTVRSIARRKSLSPFDYVSDRNKVMDLVFLEARLHGYVMKNHDSVRRGSLMGSLSERDIQTLEDNKSYIEYIEGGTLDFVLNRRILGIEIPRGLFIPGNRYCYRFRWDVTLRDFILI